MMKNKYKILYTLLCILLFVLVTNWEKHVAPLYKEIQIDSLYVDFNNEIYYHIKYFRNTEECVKKVIQSIDSTNYYRRYWFITDKKGMYIEHRVFYIDDSKTDRFLLAKCDTFSETYSSLLFEMSKPKPVPMERMEGEEITYIKGDFVTLNFDVLESFIETIPVAITGSDIPHTYVLLNSQDEKKIELSILDGVRCCRFKVY